MFNLTHAVGHLHQAIPTVLVDSPHDIFVGMDPTVNGEQVLDTVMAEGIDGLMAQAGMVPPQEIAILFAMGMTVGLLASKMADDCDTIEQGLTQSDMALLGIPFQSLIDPEQDPRMIDPQDPNES